ncbi:MULTISPECIES: FecR family protein [Labilibaculum]|uniref:DUF4974 domain-containing protein n=2 Tax=Labilibaculum TaxID=2060722 RepID=A0A7M4D275_9BACT|nr:MULTISPECIES: FecR domain-containing protein [Labilibaculum]MUP36754.1 DUF4974 domain-containing protein [Labilibaculum euxinus]MVB05959.1 DUF4974 domain-containing protein [Labilibaculum euxinus]
MDIIDIMQTNREKLNRFLSGKYSFNDYLSISSYFKNEECNEELKKQMEVEWNETKPTEDNKERLAGILNRLHDHINSTGKIKETVFQSFYNVFSKIAVVLLIPALITVGVLSYFSINSPKKVESWAEIHSPIGSRVKFQLPDGTQGWLNSGSTIKYPVNFAQNRKVEMSGEAWFDVVHINSDGFRVLTPYLDVKVLGTQFNVNAYDDDITTGVILERGKVIVLGKDESVKGELDPNQQLIYNKSTKKLVKSCIDAKSYTSWKEGLLIFKNATMAEIAKRLERRYNVEIILHGDALKASIFRASFQDENLEDICKMLSTVAPIQYKIHKRLQQPDSTFLKKKIEMWLN